MPVVAEFLQRLIHISLLFFLGLGDSFLTVNTTIPIAVCSLLYVFSMLVPNLYRQSPFRSSSILLSDLVSDAEGALAKIPRSGLRQCS